MDLRKQLGSKTFVVKDQNDAVLAAERLLQGYSPIFLLSAVTGSMVSELKLLLNVMTRRPLQVPAQQKPDLQIQVDEIFPSVPGMGLVVAGRVVHGTAKPGDSVRLGPMVDGAGELIKDGFVNLRVSSIRVQDHPVEQLKLGASGTFALKSSGKAKDLLTSRALSRSRLLVGTKSVLAPSRWLRASVTVLQHPSSIRARYEPVLHVGMVRQTARVVSMTGLKGEALEMLRAGDTAEILFRWAHWPEIVEPGCALVFRENSVKGVGSVTWVGDLDVKESKRPSKVKSKGKTSKAKASKVEPKRKKGRDSKQKRSKK